MSWLIFILILLTCWHFLFEAAIAPNWRMEQRFKLFALRDAIRKDLNHDDFKVREVAGLLQHRVNTAIAALPYLDLSDLVTFQARLGKDRDLKDRLSNQTRIIKACNAKRLRDASREIDLTVMKAFLFNAGGWFIFLLPIVFGYGLYSKALRLVSSFVGAPDEIIAQALGPAFRRQQAFGR